MKSWRTATTQYLVIENVASAAGRDFIMYSSTANLIAAITKLLLEFNLVLKRNTL
jgi:hypothetical protein